MDFSWFGKADILRVPILFNASTYDKKLFIKLSSFPFCNQQILEWQIWIINNEEKKKVGIL